MIVLTARTEEIDIVLGLDAGAVDYVTKPFRLAELLARVRAQLRRPPTDTSEAIAEPIQLGDLRIDVGARRVFLRDAETPLRPREYDLLLRLVRDAGRVVRREDLMSDVWDEHWFGSTKTLDVHVAELRRKLDGDGPSRIATVRSVGYRFESA